MGSKEEIPLASLDQKIGTFQTVTRYAQFASDANVDMGDQSERLLVYRQPYRFRRTTRLRGFFYQSAQVRAHSHPSRTPSHYRRLLGDYTLIIWILDH